MSASMPVVCGMLGLAPGYGWTLQRLRDTHITCTDNIHAKWPHQSFESVFPPGETSEPKGKKCKDLEWAHSSSSSPSKAYKYQNPNIGQINPICFFRSNAVTIYINIRIKYTKSLAGYLLRLYIYTEFITLSQYSLHGSYTCR